ncbi:MAG: type II secretion system GspH family protein [Lactobacillus sp.]|nr:type II secretion system GspH family protein [Lactobacillus sp.]
MMFKKIKAFTLIETIVTLAVVCLLVLMPTLYVKNIKEQIVLDSSTRQIKSTINKYLHRSTVERKSYFLSYFDNNSSIQVMEPDKVTKVYLDRHVRVYNFDNFYISNRGTISPRTITVKNGNKEKKIKIQMTWGRMVEE